MQNNVQKMIDNQNELGDIEARAGDLKNVAFNVKNNADQLRKEAARRNLRIMLLTAVVGIAILAYIIVPLATSGDEVDVVVAEGDKAKDAAGDAKGEAEKSK